MGLFGNYLSGQSQAKAQKKAAREYIRYQEGQRNKFLGAPENVAARGTLDTYMEGKTGYDDETLANINANTYEDYGRSMRDYNRNIGRTGVRPGGGYTPGRRARSERLQQENMGTRRAEALRATQIGNAELALDNQRWAFSQSPTYSQGLPATPNIGYQVFRDKNAQGPNWKQLLGNIGDTAINTGVAFATGGGAGGGKGDSPMSGQLNRRAAGNAFLQSYNNPSYSGSRRNY